MGAEDRHSSVKSNFLKYGEFIYNSLKDCFKDDKIKDRIYPLIAETGTTFPFCIYDRNITNYTFLTKDNTVEDISFSITIVSDSYKQTLQLLEQLYNYYQLAYFVNEKIKTQVITTSENYNDEAFTQNITIKIIN
jgi:hypothetical protein